MKAVLIAMVLFANMEGHMPPRMPIPIGRLVKQRGSAHDLRRMAASYATAYAAAPSYDGPSPVTTPGEGLSFGTPAATSPSTAYFARLKGATGDVVATALLLAVGRPASGTAGVGAAIYRVDGSLWSLVVGGFSSIAAGAGPLSRIDLQEPVTLEHGVPYVMAIWTDTGSLLLAGYREMDTGIATVLESARPITVATGWPTVIDVGPADADDRDVQVGTGLVYWGTVGRQEPFSRGNNGGMDIY